MVVLDVYHEGVLDPFTGHAQHFPPLERHLVMMGDSDARLVLRVRAGDRSAAERLAGRYLPAVRACALAIEWASHHYAGLGRRWAAAYWSPARRRGPAGDTMSKGSVRQALMLVVAVFLCGFVVGIVSQDWIEELPLLFAASDRDYDDDLEDVIDGEERLLHRLYLTVAQRDSVAVILDRRESLLVSYWAQRVPEMQQIIDASRQELRALLTVEQRQEYDVGLTNILRDFAATRD
ncbi:MAG: hypothetical protein WEE89_20565 [Gemmatimonadota bacterium]